MDFCSGIRSDLTQFVSVFEPWAQKISSDLSTQLSSQADLCREHREAEVSLNEERLGLQNLAIAQKKSGEEEEFKANLLSSQAKELSAEAS